MSEEDKQRLKEYQKNYRKAKKTISFFFICVSFFQMYKTRKELVSNKADNDYTKDKYYFQKDKKPTNINEIDAKKIVLSNETCMVNKVLKNIIFLI